MLLQHSRGQFPILLNRGVNVGNYVHVDDLVQGYILAIARGRIGERYILGGDNASLLQLIQWVNQFSGHTHFQINFTPSMAIAYAKLQLRLAEWTGILSANYSGVDSDFSPKLGFRLRKSQV